MVVHCAVGIVPSVALYVSQCSCLIDTVPKLHSIPKTFTDDILFHVHIMQVIKRRIEALIDREYLERDADNQNTYKYMA